MCPSYEALAIVEDFSHLHSLVFENSFVTRWFYLKYHFIQYLLLYSKQAIWVYGKC